MKIFISKNYDLMSRRAANIVIKQIEKKKNSVLGLPTGKTPTLMYKKLRESYKHKKVDFRLVTTFNLDEYLGLGEKDKNSYRFFMRQNFFNHVNIKEKNIYFPNTSAKNLTSECLIYEKLLTRKKIDLIILGIGLNGHIGFNELGSAFNSKTRVVTITPSTKRANAKYFKTLKDVPQKAITMGIYSIMKARRIMLLASGKEKAEIVARALKDKPNKNIPASYLKLHPRLIVVLDKAASGKL